MKWAYVEYGTNCSNNADCDQYGILNEQEEAIRKPIKSHFRELKEKQIKDLLDTKIWSSQKQILLKAKQLQQSIGTQQHDDMNGYDAALKATGIKLDSYKVFLFCCYFSAPIMGCGTIKF